MKIRARYIHALETFIDNALGYLINIGTTILVFNMLLGYEISIQDNLTAGVFFFLVAWARKYILRRLFSNWIEKIYAKRDS